MDIRFTDSEVARRFGDLGRLRHEHGVAGARRISQRMQQLEAMTSLDDLAFMPFESRVMPDGTTQVDVSSELSVVIEADEQDHRGKSMMGQLTVLGLVVNVEAAEAL